MAARRLVSHRASNLAVIWQLEPTAEKRQGEFLTEKSHNSLARGSRFKRALSRWANKHLAAFRFRYTSNAGNE